MKKEIHPNYNRKAQFKCISCGKVHTFGSTVDSASIEVCSNCHPVYTGNQETIVDTYNRVNAFKDKMKQSDTNAVISKKKKKKSRNVKVKSVTASSGPSLQDLLKGSA